MLCKNCGVNMERFFDDGCQCGHLSPLKCYLCEKCCLLCMTIDADLVARIAKIGGVLDMGISDNNQPLKLEIDKHDKSL